MKTTLLESLHNRALYLIGVYKMAEYLIQEKQKTIQIEDSKNQLERYLIYSKGDYELRIAQLKAVQFRIKMWHIEVSNRISKLSNYIDIENRIKATRLIH